MHKVGTRRSLLRRGFGRRCSVRSLTLIPDADTSVASRAGNSLHTIALLAAPAAPTSINDSGPMATAKKVSTATVKKAVAAKKPVTAKPAAVLKPIKTAFNKSTLAAYLAEQAGLEPKAAKAFMAALEATLLASVHKKGLGEFTLPGLMKVTAIQVPAKKKRMGIDPFTKVERMFAAKPATTKIKVRALKKLKDAAL